MSETFEPTFDRRQMLRSGLRYTLAAGIAAGSLGLIVRSTRSSGEATCPIESQGDSGTGATAGLPSSAEKTRVDKPPVAPFRSTNNLRLNRRLPCQTCDRLTTCSLPQAAAARPVRKERES
jgi:hypothetical protein